MGAGVGVGSLQPQTPRTTSTDSKIKNALLNVDIILNPHILAIVSYYDHKYLMVRPFSEKRLHASLAGNSIFCTAENFPAVENAFRENVKGTKFVKK